MEEIKHVEIINPYGFIYCTTNMINGKKYIGQRKFNKDWKYYLGSGKIFKQAIKKYGKENFSREIIAIAYSKEALDKLEIEFIKMHNAVLSDDYYNLSYGGENSMTGLHHSDETRQKMSLTQKGRLVPEETRKKISNSLKGDKNPNYGKPKSEETKQKLSKSKKGHIDSEEHKYKLSVAKTGDKNPNYGKSLSEKIKQKLSDSHIGNKCYMYGKHHSEETKQKMRDSRIKFTQAQAIEIREKYFTGNYTQTELAKEYFTSRSIISNVINFKRSYKK